MSEVKQVEETLPMHVALYYKEGSSDKVYAVALEPQDFVEANDLWKVNFAYGKRGSAMATGTKTQTAVPRAKAIIIMNKLIAEKQAKGYTIDESGKAFMHVDKEVTGVHVQLLSPITEQQAEALLADDDYMLQEKMDGERRALRKQDKELLGINRKGLAVAIPPEVSKDLLDHTVFHNLLLDGEIIGDIVYVFDIIDPKMDFEHRYKVLKSIVEDSKFTNIKLVRAYSSYVPKAKLYRELLAAGKEGVVFKHKKSVYTPGKPKSVNAQFKYKFYETASFIVNKINEKRSVEVMLFAEDNTYVFVGNVTIPPNHKIPDAGTVIEVRYLYAFPEGSIFQPVYLGERNDIDASECVVTQLKYKA